MPSRRTKQGGKVRGPTRKKPKSGKGKVLEEFRAFKNMFRRWADEIQLDWNGKPAFSPGAEYRFILPNPMVNFVVSLVKRSHTGIDPETLERPDKAEEEKQVIEETAKLRQAIEADAMARAEADPEPAPAPEPEAVRNDRGVLDRRTFRTESEENV